MGKDKKSKVLVVLDRNSECTPPLRCYACHPTCAHHCHRFEAIHPPKCDLQPDVSQKPVRLEIGSLRGNKWLLTEEPPLSEVGGKESGKEIEISSEGVRAAHLLKIKCCRVMIKLQPRQQKKRSRSSARDI